MSTIFFSLLLFIFPSFIFQDHRVLYLGLIQSLFEGSMYVFVLEWTPAITRAVSANAVLTDASNPPVPHGYIFASYMVRRY
jgi:hypothetical protein